MSLYGIILLTCMIVKPELNPKPSAATHLIHHPPQPVLSGLACRSLLLYSTGATP